MGKAAKAILDAARRLPRTDRARVIKGLIDSLDDGADENVEEAWATEAERRLRELERGEVTPIPWSKVRKAVARRGRGRD